MTLSFTQDYFSGREFQLRLWLQEFIGKPIHALEVGSFEGRSTVWFLSQVLTHKEASITCIDTFLGSVEHSGMDLTGTRHRFYSNVAPYASHVRLMVGDSRAILPTLPFGRFSFAYIDGSHRAPDVLSDASLAWPLLVPGGLMIFDDYLWDGHKGTPNETRIGIDQFVDSIKNEATIFPAYQIAFRKTPHPA